MHLYAAQLAFDNLMKRRTRKRNEREIDMHVYREYGEFHRNFLAHAQRTVEQSKQLPNQTQEVIRRIMRFNPETNHVDLQREIHLGLRHGTQMISASHEAPQYPVVFQVSRIKELKRLGRKFARNICLGLREYRLLKKFLDGSELTHHLPEKIRENLGAMKAHGFLMPFDGREGTTEYSRLPPLDGYLLLRSRVSDVFGTMYVTRTREEANELIYKRLITRKYVYSAPYSVLWGQLLYNNKESKSKQAKIRYHYREGFVIDDHLKLDPESKEIPEGNQTIFTYFLPDFEHPLFHYRVDFGVCSLMDYAEDAVGGRGSHLIYEMRQAAKVKTWNPIVQQLNAKIEEAVLSILEGVNIHNLSLYRPQKERGV